MLAKELVKMTILQSHHTSNLKHIIELIILIQFEAESDVFKRNSLHEL